MHIKTTLKGIVLQFYLQSALLINSPCSTQKKMVNRHLQLHTKYKEFFDVSPRYLPRSQYLKAQI